jgi:choline dehydrogenase-like flavoprotein
MIKNLLKKGKIDQSADIVVIGAGTVGLMVSSLLAQKGFSVVNLESGDYEQKDDTHPLNDVVYKKSTYSSSTNGRFRCLGGTSTRWGAAMLPFLSKDIVDGMWPILPEEISKYLKKIESLFDLSHEPYDRPDILNGNNLEFIPRLAKLPSYNKRNVFNIFEKYIKSENNLTTWINATVNKFKVENEKLNELTAQAKDGSEIKVKANHFIFAAGAIETTRLILLLNRQNDNCVEKKSPLLGKNFTDHISIPIADIKIKDTKKLNRTIGYRFNNNSNMCNLRFELNESSPTRKSIPPFFGRVVYDDFSGGYEELRGLLRSLQKKRIPTFKEVIDTLKNLPWLLKAVWWRFFEKRVLFPKNEKLVMHIIMEQIANPSNKISLSDIKKDMFNQPLTEITWETSKEDSDNIFKASKSIQEFWNSSNLCSMADFNLRTNEVINKEISQADGIHHPTGSTPMSSNASQGVVDKDLKMFALKNTRLLSTSVFPLGGGANPTMALLMMGARCVDQICAEKS